MYARYTTVRGDPSRIDAALEQVDGQVRDSVEATEGNRGFAVLAGAEGGRIVGASYWDSAESLRSSEEALADSRAAAARALAGDVSLERFEVIIGFRHSVPARGTPVGLARFGMDPGRVEEAITQLGLAHVPDR